MRTGQPHAWVAEAGARRAGSGDKGESGVTERWVEIPWVLSRVRRDCRDGARVLDVGSVESVYLSLLRPHYELWSLDVRGEPTERFVVCDARWSPFPDGFFDAVICVSAIEHIGFQAYGYGYFLDPNGDHVALAEMKRILKPGSGRILLTAPFGRPQDYGWFRVYGPDEWKALIGMSYLRILEEEFWKIHPFPVRCRPEDLATAGWNPEKGSAEGLVCECLCKD